MAGNPGKIENILIRIEPTIKDQLTSKAAAEGHTVTWVLTRAIEDYLAGTWQPLPRPKRKQKGAA